MEEKLSLFPELNLLKRVRDGKEMESYLEHNIPDLILMDIELPGPNGITLTQIVRKKYSQTCKILIVTVFEDDDLIFEAIMSGIDGYLLKEIAPLNLKNAIHDAMNGGAAMSPSIAARTLKILRNPQYQNNKPKEDFQLSKREVEVLELLSSGATYKKIASALFLSEGTIRKHVENIYKKLRVHNKVEAIAVAHQNKLI